MPRGKEFCPYENEYFDVGQFEIIDDTRIHRKDPLHRATDGALVQEVGKKVFPVADLAFAPLRQRPQI
jgi:hypothetical protein